MASKISVALLHQAQAAALSAEAFRLYTLALVVAVETLSDGHIARLTVSELALVPEPSLLVAELVSGGLWASARGGWRIVGYLDHHPSAERARRALESRHQNGARGGRPRKNRIGFGAETDSVSGGRQASAKVAPVSTRGNAPAKTEPVSVENQIGFQPPGGVEKVHLAEVVPLTRENVVAETYSVSVETGSVFGEVVEAEVVEEFALMPAPPRTDVEDLCKRLAGLIIENGSKAPTISKTWRDAARLLLDVDKRDFQKSMNLIDWCQKDPWWKARILSMAKFRAKYDEIRLDAVNAWKRGNGGGWSGRTVPEGMDYQEAVVEAAKRRISTTDVAVAQVQIAAQQLEDAIASGEIPWPSFGEGA